MRRLLFVLFILCMVTWGLFLYLLVDRFSVPELTELPTLYVIPSLTPFDTPTATITPTPTHTLTSTPTFTATVTPTLSVRMLEMYAVMPGVSILPTLTEFPFGTVLLSAPPNPVEPLPDATQQPPPYTGWFSFESDHPNVHYSSPWEKRQVIEASRGQYHRTENPRSTVTFAFEGEGLRIRYVAARNMGTFDVIVDGAILDTIDAYAPDLSYPGTRVYSVGKGTHLLEISPTGQKNPQSEGVVVALDAIQVFKGDTHTVIVTPPAITSTPFWTAQFELVSAPFTAQPTTPPAEITASVIIAYDENGNKAVDPAEGVNGISVRVVEVGTNRVITQTVTDTSGYAQLNFTAAAQMRVVVPYFGKVWDISRGRTQFTLLLAPANQPGLIP